jgi:hypothetical protein
LFFIRIFFFQFVVSQGEQVRSATARDLDVRKTAVGSGVSLSVQQLVLAAGSGGGGGGDHRYWAVSVHYITDEWRLTRRVLKWVVVEK